MKLMILYLKQNIKLIQVFHLLIKIVFLKKKKKENNISYYKRNKEKISYSYINDETLGNKKKLQKILLKRLNNYL